MAPRITLRAHHVLCLQGFEGKGYSPEFIENFATIAQTLAQTPQTPVTLTANQDDICSACPHHSDTGCQKDATANARMQARDHATLAALAQAANTTRPISEWLLSSAQAFHTKHDARATCFDCDWRPLCRFYQKLADAEPNKS